MYRFLMRPKWVVFHIIVIVLVVAMLNLAFWQLRRLHDRQHFNSVVRTHTNQPIAPVADVLTSGATAADVEWRRVSLAGHYLVGQEVLVVNRSQGGRSGRDALDPIALADGSLLVVNRGFVPADQPVPPTPAGDVRIVGRLRASEARRFGQGEDASGVRLTEVRRIEISKLAPQLGGRVQPMYLELLETEPAQGAIPEPVAAPVLSEGPHLSYTIQWLIFSACAIVGWVLVVHRALGTRRGVPRRRRRGPPPIADELARVG